MALDPNASYYDRGGIETIDIIRAKLTKEEYLGYLKGNLIKYLCRYGDKESPQDTARKVHTYARLLNELEQTVGNDTE